jgi:hypothetical protein
MIDELEEELRGMKIEEAEEDRKISCMLDEVARHIDAKHSVYSQPYPVIWYELFEDQDKKDFLQELIVIVKKHLGEKL